MPGARQPTATEVPAWIYKISSVHTARRMRAGPFSLDPIFGRMKKSGGFLYKPSKD
ncbi:hypothetical protein C4J85_1588 [Pseudomonas sp. R4-34-07]|nr:hypothetical protein C4J85_1588 [Pseudomonas sp. R4-34-07]